MSRWSALPLTLPLFLLASLVTAQTSPPAKPNPAEPEAHKLLEDITARIPALRSRNNRLLVSCEVADLIWDKNEKRARGLFEAVMKEFIDLIAAYDASDPETANDFSLVYQQRQQIVERIANHDPQLALSFLRATRRSEDSESGLNSDNERNQEMQLAGLIASRDPELALKLARSSLARGLSHNVVSLLGNLQKKDAATAQTFYSELVERVGAEDLAQNLESLTVAAGLLNSFQPPQAAEQSYRQLAEIFVNRVLAVSPTDPSSVQLAQNLFHQVRNVLPLIEKYLPVRVPSLQNWSRLVERTFDQNHQRYLEMNELIQRASVEEIIAAAPRFPAELQPQIIQQAIWKALNTGDADRARQLATELISDSGQRQQMIGQIEAHQLWKAVADNKVADARRLLGTIKPITQRIQIIIQLAASLASRGDKKGAVALLDEARVALAESPGSAQKLMGQLQLARSYTDLDTDQGITLLQALIVQVNHLVAAAVVLDGFENRYLNEGEWQRQNRSGLSGIVIALEQALGHYAGRMNSTGDSELTETAVRRLASANSLAERLERPEIRLQAQLTLVRAVLQRPTSNRGINSSTLRRTVTIIQ